MTVHKSERKQSKFQVVVNANRIRKELLEYVLVDFGLTQGITETEQWLLMRCRDRIFDCLSELVSEITLANSVNVHYLKTWDAYYERYHHQNLALAKCHQLIQEIQTITDCVHGINVNKYMRTIRLIDDEIGLIKGWRKADNQVKKLLPPLG